MTWILYHDPDYRPTINTRWIFREEERDGFYFSKSGAYPFKPAVQNARSDPGPKRDASIKEIDHPFTLSEPSDFHVAGDWFREHGDDVTADACVAFGYHLDTCKTCSGYGMIDLGFGPDYHDPVPCPECSQDGGLTIE